MHLIAYGSLMDVSILNKKRYKIVRVPGRRRIFNKMASRSVWKKGSEGKEVAALNVVKYAGGNFNAVLYQINDEDLKKLKEREKKYHVERTDAIETGTGKIIKNCLIFASADVGNDVFPIKKYIQVCRKAAYSLGKEFGEEFDSTTYVADGRTLKKYLKQQKTLLF